MLKRKWYSQEEVLAKLNIDQAELNRLIIEKELGACVEAPLLEYGAIWAGRWSLLTNENWGQWNCSNSHYDYPLVGEKRNQVSRSDRLPSDNSPLYGIWRLPNKVASELLMGNQPVNTTGLIPVVPRYFTDPSDMVQRAAFMQVPPKGSWLEKRVTWPVNPTDIVIANDDLERLAPDREEIDQSSPKIINAATTKILLRKNFISNNPDSDLSSPQKKERTTWLGLLEGLAKINEQKTPIEAAKWISTHVKLNEFKSKLPNRRTIDDLMEKAWNAERSQ